MAYLPRIDAVRENSRGNRQSRLCFCLLEFVTQGGFALLAALFLVSHGPPLNAQPAAINRVLELDGNASFVELPPNIFNSLDDATVEAWVRWDSLRGFARVFNYGQRRRDLSLAVLNQQDLWFVIVDSRSNENREVIIPHLVKPRTWCHVAAVSGKQGMRVTKRA